MTDNQNFADENKTAMPPMLNVLTILTFIGSGIGILSGIWSYMKAGDSYKKLLEAQDKLSEAPAWAKKFMGPEMLEMAKKSMENKLPVLILTLVGSVVCIYGALEMRKLKKQGFILWMAGEVLPIIGSVLFIGTGIFTGFTAFFMIFPFVFIVLYSYCRKYLVY